MLRGTLQTRSHPGKAPAPDYSEKYFRWRGSSVSRLEGLSDAIFALALTLLVVRLEVPRTFAEVRFALISAPVYLACFALFLWIWSCHYQFHRRYGLEGPAVVALDGALLFCVLLFALPLRFIAELIWTDARLGAPYVLDTGGAIVRGVDGAPAYSLTTADNSVLMLFYAGGFALLFVILAAQTAFAYSRRDTLALDEVERYLTRATLRAHLMTAVVGVTAVALASLGPRPAQLAGLVFFALGPLHGLLGWRRGVGAHRRAARD
jgi:hypothetical protein